jgi:hypothetical protein
MYAGCSTTELLFPCRRAGTRCLSLAHFGNDLLGSPRESVQSTQFNGTACGWLTPTVEVDPSLRVPTLAAPGVKIRIRA